MNQLDPRVINELREMKINAHTLKSSSSSLGAMKLAELSKEPECCTIVGDMENQAF
jgi:HPt (histidine-containing phosphotransfer) domain-containing protein